MILLLLDKIEALGDKELITILRAWQMIEGKKLKTRILEVINLLEKVESTPKLKNTDQVIDFNANKRWLQIPVEIRKKLEQNVFCSTCLDVVQIVNYKVVNAGKEIGLDGICKTCGNKVFRVID